MCLKTAIMGGVAVYGVNKLAGAAQNRQLQSISEYPPRSSRDAYYGDQEANYYPPPTQSQSRGIPPYDDQHRFNRPPQPTYYADPYTTTPQATRQYPQQFYRGPRDANGYAPQDRKPQQYPYSPDQVGSASPPAYNYYEPVGEARKYYEARSMPRADAGTEKYYDPRSDKQIVLQRRY
jgi:hypothetical protein